MQRTADPAARGIVSGSGFDPAERERIAAARALALQRCGERLAPADLDAVASILMGLRADAVTVSAGHLYAAVLGCGASVSEIASDDREAVRLVDAAARLDHFAAAERGSQDPKRAAQYAENLRKMLLALVDDVRAILVALAHRLHALRTAPRRPEAERLRLARETQTVHAPIANRLGIWSLKWELEDLALRHSEPEAYRRIARELDERRSDREDYVASFMDALRGLLADAGIDAEVAGRAKHIYSIYKKMRRKDASFDELSDIRAVRVLVDTVAQCYAVLGIVHSHWRYLPGEFDDYIARPKPNLYRSLHTAVIGPGEKLVEVQIRTHEMHRHSELGIAAHWRYKEGTHHDPGFEQRLVWMRQLLDPRDGDHPAELVEGFDEAIGTERVYVMTPQGDVIDLPAGSTVLDFAYAIHTNIGHRCRGARVDGRIVPLTQVLESGQRVEILTHKHPQPSRDWLSPHLGYLKTPRARNRVRQWFRQLDYDRHVADGRELAEREFKRLGVADPVWPRLLERFRLARAEDVYAALGRGDVSAAQLAAALDEPVVRPPLEIRSPRKRRAVPAANPARDGVSIRGVGNVLTNIARCCRPVPDDPIVGYITRGRGVTIHRRDCPTLRNLREVDRARMIDVSWADRPEQRYPVDLFVRAYDRKGLLGDVTTAIAAENIELTDAHTHSDRKQLTATMTLTVEISDNAQLSRLIDRIARVPNVVEVARRR
ncbi:MAG: bifunctional (p)ppGpp synthetase/guanosine-3',5'-bis(diphosphate) 3'-pyrophosphohydrolase [Chromatiales bacterium]|nr:bifunctional (p)ppGpp synthetase/guanosine-3',5'-bis(diphosphate) 3'-pyrophosphohydrolase [Chromatiales bacterium]